MSEDNNENQNDNNQNKKAAKSAKDLAVRVEKKLYDQKLKEWEAKLAEKAKAVNAAEAVYKKARREYQDLQADADEELFDAQG